MTVENGGYELPTKSEIVNDAIMSGQAAIILEGITDIQVYQRIVSRLDRDVVLKPVELIANFGEGCSEVVRLFAELEEEDDLRPYVPKNILGIIDKDVRDFRGEMPQNGNVVVLKHYSMESHFACRSVITRCLADSTYAPQDDRLSQVAEQAYDKFCNANDVLFLASVEALRGAVEDNYQSAFRYSDGVGRLNDAGLVHSLEAKRQALVDFAEPYGLSASISSLKRFVKGKVLLDGFCNELRQFIRELPGGCGTTGVPHCDYCDAGLNEKCCYRTKPGVTENSLKNAILGQLPLAEFEYLIQELQEQLNSGVA
ncbi:DUF4435 domain-containing protein [Pseudophaeobacter sp.]|uniref:DUF4435 domain-containing protein n=1 Tax=Pseudophaeobacter sp. TaxID=1971739 RepID=UPI003A9879EF